MVCVVACSSEVGAFSLVEAATNTNLCIKKMQKLKILAHKIQDKYGGVPLLLSKYILPKTPWNNLLLRFRQLMDYHCRRKTTNANQKAKSWKNLQFRSIKIRWSATNTQKFHFIEFEITWTCCIIFLESCGIRSGGSSHRYKFENRKRQKERISVNRPRYTRWCATNFLPNYFLFKFSISRNCLQGCDQQLVHGAWSLQITSM